MDFVIVSIAGLILGSFANAIIYRLPDIDSLIHDRSECPHCKAKLPAKDLIPVISYILLRGKCRECGKPISWQYPAIEIVMAILFILCWYYFHASLYSIFLMLLSFGLVIIFVYDLMKMEISNEGLIYLIILTLIWVAWGLYLNSQSIDLIVMRIWAAIIGGIFWLILNLVSKGKWIGFGDFKLGLILGFILAFPNVWVFLFLTAIIGGLVALALIASGKRHLKQKIAFAPIMVTAFFVTAFWGTQILDWYLRII